MNPTSLARFAPSSHPATRGSLLALLLASAVSTACSFTGGMAPGVLGAGGDASSSAGAATAGDAGAPSRQGSGGAVVVGSESTEGGGGAGGGTGEDTCASLEDLPDEGFEDTNCDGIDGDASAAIFVSPTGDDADAGTRTEPVRSIGQAVTLAQGAGKAVYVCAATYTERVVVQDQGVSLHGGYDCTTWERTSAARATIEAEGGPVLEIRDVAAPMVVERIELHALDAVEPGQSAIAALVVNADDVRFVRAHLTAGAGADGAPGAAVEDLTAVPPQAQRGESAPQIFCGPYVTSCVTSVAPGGFGAFVWSCPDGSTTRGGPGGDGGNVFVGAAATAGGVGRPAGSGAGADGADGLGGARGAAAAAGFGAISLAGYLPSNAGQPGNAGANGQSGGGGDGTESRSYYQGSSDLPSAVLIGGGGGQGGYGGCGGPGGPGGGGGGASIALLSIASTVRLEHSRLVTGAGGAGAAGALGAAGGPGGVGGFGGLSSCYSEDCGPFTRVGAPSGGDGGLGGDGGEGGPGGGGPSIPLVSVGLEPELGVNVVLEPAGGGAGGPAPVGGLPGARGLSQQAYHLDALEG